MAIKLGGFKWIRKMEMKRRAGPKLNVRKKHTLRAVEDREKRESLMLMLYISSDEGVTEIDDPPTANVRATPQKTSKPDVRLTHFRIGLP
jgi:hypothetical protein